MIDVSCFCFYIGLQISEASQQIKPPIANSATANVI